MLNNKFNQEIIRDAASHSAQGTISHTGDRVFQPEVLTPSHSCGLSRPVKKVLPPPLVSFSKTRRGKHWGRGEELSDDD
jgi:hypothetical protein